MNLNNNAVILDQQFIIEQTLWELGVPPHLKGFYYLHVFRSHGKALPPQGGRLHKRG